MADATNPAKGRISKTNMGHSDKEGDPLVNENNNNNNINSESMGICGC